MFKFYIIISFDKKKTDKLRQNLASIRPLAKFKKFLMFVGNKMY